jgi:hypothetical protein
MITFSDAGEFLEELKANSGKRLLRVTTRREMNGAMPIWHLSLVAGFIDRGGRLVELTRYIGDVMSHADAKSPTWMKLDEERESLKAALSELGHEVRAGRFLLEQRP